MEAKWLEDFISLAETRSFSRSATLRNVTQPAFSRRIRSLEAWVGADLIDRTEYPTKLTKVGEVFYEQALEILGQINGARALLRGQRPAAAAVIDFAAPHTLSLTFFPKWLAQVEYGFGKISCRLLALNVHDAAMQLVEGGCDLLMCYHHPEQPVQLDPGRYDMLLLGSEAIYPYSCCDRQGNPVYNLPGSAATPLPFLSYSDNAFLGRMVDLILRDVGMDLHLDKVYETDMAEGLKVMALAGHGIAFLPESAVLTEVKTRRLARADSNVSGVCGGTMEVRVYREKPDERKPGKRAVERLWQHLLGMAEPVAPVKRKAPVKGRVGKTG